MIGFLTNTNEMLRETSVSEWQVNTAGIKYAQCWEDTDVLLDGLNVQPGDTCLSISSAGDNTLALLTGDPEHVIALDLNPAQLACLELRMAAYRELDHGELLELVGSRPSLRRDRLYSRCRTLLSSDSRRFWDGQGEAIAQGFSGSGQLERYFTLFRRRVLPLIHGKHRVHEMLLPKSSSDRIQFYQSDWNTWRWKFFSHCFFSRVTMSLLGREEGCFRYVEGSVSDQILSRAHRAFSILDPSENPYLIWILTGSHQTALPYALREENFEVIRANLDRLELRCGSIESLVKDYPGNSIDRFNLSDIFEYMSESIYHRLLDRLLFIGRSGGRLAYWNLLVSRRRPESMADRLRPLSRLSRRLHRVNKTFFYSDFVVEEIR